MKMYEAKADPRYSIAQGEWVAGRLEMLGKVGVAQGPQCIRLDPAVHGPEKIDSNVATASLDS